VMDILGNEVKTIRLSERGAQKINISDLSKGIYFGNVVVNNETVTIKKLIVR
ncbi:MAG: T9SS type A sorting domain-containing protein, partial [Pelagibacterales bacterium]|nr:T9SS type A sorting domain-containing protein [Pelagibacterales bacterium]